MRFNLFKARLDKIQGDREMVSIIINVKIVVQDYRDDEKGVDKFNIPEIKSDKIE